MDRSGVKRAWAAFRHPVHPVHPENRDHLARLWAELPEALRDDRQMVGRQWEGCAATAGAMPRCDLACTSCYLSREADHTPELPVDEVEAQLEAIRAHVGRWGNVQLTDGEVTLRSDADLVRILRTARRLELIPMLMTHGDRLLHAPGRLELLVREGGLREVCFHVDTTQRGRQAPWNRRVRDERELHPLRDRVAKLVRATRRSTGLPLRIANTITVVPENLEGMADVTDWAVRNADVVRILGFQPVAQVGRTLDDGEVTTDRLWERVAAGLPGAEVRDLDAGRVHVGHHACNRAVMGLVVRGHGPLRYVPWREEHAASERFVLDMQRATGGVKARADEPLVAAARVAGLVARNPVLLARGLVRYAPRFLRRLGAGGPGGGAGFLARLATGRARLLPFALNSHRFMDAETLASPEGQEREAACVFRVPHRGEMVSMCALNAAGLREAWYAELRAKASAATRTGASSERTPQPGPSEPCTDTSSSPSSPPSPSSPRARSSCRRPTWRRRARSSRRPGARCSPSVWTSAGSWTSRGCARTRARCTWPLPPSRRRARAPSRSASPRSRTRSPGGSTRTTRSRSTTWSRRAASPRRRPRSSGDASSSWAASA
jgi:molybdenum cofactor biosynthesis enzyme MoaA